MDYDQVNLSIHPIHSLLIDCFIYSKPDTFWAGYSSSGVVEALVDYWAYFEPIRQYMAQNCSADIEAVIAHVDDVFINGNDSAIADLKATFGLENVTHNDDAAGALRNNL